MKKSAVVVCVTFALSLMLVGCGADKDSTTAYQHTKEQSFVAETQKSTEYEMSNQDNSKDVTSNQENNSNITRGSDSTAFQKQMQSTEGPTATVKPQSTDCPTATVKPQTTDCPASTVKPESTKCPVVIIKPQATNCPEATTKPTTKPTVAPTAKPTVKPTVVPTAKPTVKPTVAPTVKPTTKPTNTPGNSSGIDSDAYITEVLALVNQERAKEGLSPLTTNAKLKKAANKRAQEIVTLFSHTRPDGTNFVSVLKEYDISYSVSGENIAYGQKSPAAVMNAWMNSSGHRANILSSKFGKVGIGCYVKNGVIYWTQVFTN